MKRFSIVFLVIATIVTGMITAVDYGRNDYWDLYQTGFVLLCVALAGVIAYFDKKE